MTVKSSGKRKAFIQFDQSALEAADDGALVSATLVVTIDGSPNNWGSDGRTIDVHRLTQDWTEHGITYNCADDTNPSNSSTDCAAEDEWELDGAGPNPWLATPSATQLITNGLSGELSFDVTADVQAWVDDPAQNHGWILVGNEVMAQSTKRFTSRHSGTTSQRPRLTIEYVPEVFYSIGTNDADLKDGPVKISISNGLATLDYKDGLDQSGFAITNPNAPRTCGCGQSFS